MLILLHYCYLSLSVSLAQPLRLILIFCHALPSLIFSAVFIKIVHISEQWKRKESKPVGGVICPKKLIANFPHLSTVIHFDFFFHLQIYLEYRTKFGNAYDTLIRAAQIAFLLWPFIVGLSRISDHKHHWSDVLGGAIIGIIWAVVCSVISSKDSRKIEKIIQTTETDEQHSYHIS